MRGFWAVLLAITPFFEAAAQEKVSFTTALHPEGSTVYVFSPSVVRLVKTDSATVKSGKFIITLPKGFVRGAYKIGTQKSFGEAVLGGADKVFVISSEGLVSGGKEQEAYNQLQSLEAGTQKSLNDLQQAYNQQAEKGFTQAEQLRVTNLTRKKADSIYTIQERVFAGIAKKYTNTLAGKMAEFMVPAASDQEKTYFPGPAKFTTDSELAWPNAIQKKMTLWLQRYLPQDLEVYEKSALEALDRAPEGSKFKENQFAVTAMLFAGLDQAFLRPVTKAWLKSYPNNAQAKELMAQLPPPQPEVGDEAPDIVLNDSAGKQVALSGLRGKVVLIDFWASWCGPCRQENPNVVKTYQLFKDKGFTIFSVSLDNDRGRWISAIAKDQLVWPSHVSDLKGWQSAGARLYGVNSIPATFLIGKDGKIIAKNLRGERLESELQKLIN